MSEQLSGSFEELLRKEKEERTLTGVYPNEMLKPMETVATKLGGSFEIIAREGEE